MRIPERLFDDTLGTFFPPPFSAHMSWNARTCHCQFFIFDYTMSTVPRGLSTHATSPARFDEFYAPLDMLNYDGKLNYWDSCHILQRAHFKLYHIAGFDAHSAGDTPKTYTLESLMRQNGVAIFQHIFTILCSFLISLLYRTYPHRCFEDRPRRLGIRHAYNFSQTRPRIY
jgi:hypothetical protein